MPLWKVLFHISSVVNSFWAYILWVHKGLENKQKKNVVKWILINPNQWKLLVFYLWAAVKVGCFMKGSIFNLLWQDDKVQALCLILTALWIQLYCSLQGLLGVFICWQNFFFFQSRQNYPYLCAGDNWKSVVLILILWIRLPNLWRLGEFEFCILCMDVAGFFFFFLSGNKQ